jgi:hypothetical protein
MTVTQCATNRDSDLMRLRPVRLLIAVVVAIAEGLGGCGSLDAEQVPDAARVELEFQPVFIELLEQGRAPNGCRIAKSIELERYGGDRVSLELWVERGQDGDENQIPMVGSVYAYLKVGDVAYDIGDVAGSYGLDDVEHQSLPFILENAGLRLICGVGTQYTGWHVVGYSEHAGEWVVFDVPGVPEEIDLDCSGDAELIVVFEGVHLNPPDVYIYLPIEGGLERASVAESVGFEDAYVYEDNEGYYFEAGVYGQNRPEEPSYWRYSVSESGPRIAGGDPRPEGD